MKKITIVTIVFAVILTVLAGCTVTKAENAPEDLSKLGYNVVTDRTSIPALIYAETEANPKCCVIATKDADTLYAIYFNSAADATQAYDYIKEWSQKKIAGAEVKKTGDCVYFGTENALKDFN